MIPDCAARYPGYAGFGNVTGGYTCTAAKPASIQPYARRATIRAKSCNHMIGSQRYGRAEIVNEWMREGAYARTAASPGTAANPALLA